MKGGGKVLLIIELVMRVVPHRCADYDRASDDPLLFGLTRCG